MNRARSLVAVLVVLAGCQRPAPPALAAVEPPPQRAEPGLVWRYGTMALTLTDRPCPFEDAALYLEQEGIPPARAYIAVQGDRRSTGCWVAGMDGDVMTMKPDDQEHGTIPLERFEKPRG